MDDIFQRRLARINACRGPAASSDQGGWTSATLALWNVPWPPPKGWKDALVQKDDRWFSFYGLNKEKGCVDILTLPSEVYVKIHQNDRRRRFLLERFPSNPSWTSSMFRSVNVAYPPHHGWRKALVEGDDLWFRTHGEEPEKGFVEFVPDDFT